MVKGFEKSTASRGIDIIGESNVPTTLTLGQRINEVQTGIPTSVHHNGAHNVTSSCYFYRKRMLHIPARPNRSGLARHAIRFGRRHMIFHSKTKAKAFVVSGVVVKMARRFRHGILHSRALYSVFLQKYAIFNPMIAYIAIYTSR